MAVLRKDGEETRMRILEVASRVFGEMGYTKATHAVIAREAGVNSASINFHFRSKDKLYVAVWEMAVERMTRLFPLEDCMREGMAPEERLRGLVRMFANGALAPEAKVFHKIRMAEMMTPTGILDDRIAERMKRMRKLTLGVLGELLGEGATEEEVTYCEMAVMRLFRIMPPHAHKGGMKPRLIKEWDICMRDVEKMVGYTYEFCLGGILRVRERIAARGCVKKSKKG